MEFNGTIFMIIKIYSKKFKKNTLTTHLILKYNSKQKVKHMKEKQGFNSNSTPVNNPSINKFELLSKEDKNRITNITKSIIKDYEISPLNFNVTEFLTKNLEFTLQIIKFKDEDITGILLVNENKPIIENKHKIIGINENIAMNKDDGFQRTRFIALHEFAHYKLHKKEGQMQFSARDTKKRDTKKEQEADYFACCMLMPEDILKGLVYGIQSKNEKIELVSTLFNVTRNKAETRLLDLKLI